MKKLMKKQRGFTLVELLIVMIIIGILAGGMMMVMGSSTDKAGATRALSDLRTMASATLQYYADKGPNAASPDLAALAKYNNKTLTNTEYGVGYVDNQIWVGVAVPAASRAKLLEIITQEKLEVLGLDASADGIVITSLDVYGTQPFAYMRAR